MFPKFAYFLLSLLILLLPVLLLSQTEQVGVTVSTRLNQCQDSVDNDGDFLVDYSPDPQCDSVLDDDENVTGMKTHATADFTVSGGDFSFNNSDGLAADISFPANFYSEPLRLYANSYAADFLSPRAATSEMSAELRQGPGLRARSS